MTKRTHIAPMLVMGIGLIAVFALYFGGKTLPKSKEPSVESSELPNMLMQPEKVETNFDFSAYRTEAEKQLEQGEVKEWNKISSGSNKERSSFWASIDRNDVAAIEFGEHAASENSFASWDEAGNKYIRASRESTANSEASDYFLSEGINSYLTALEIENNLATKMKLAKIYTDVSGEVMAGVVLLREIVAEDPNHVQANYELAGLSLQSGQIVKAIERLDKLIEIAPEFTEPYLLKIQVLLDQNKKEQALQVIDLAIKNTANENEKVALQDLKTNIINK